MAKGLGRVNGNPQHSDKASSYRYRLVQVTFINANKHLLINAGEDDKLRKVNSIADYYKEYKFMTGGQLDAIDNVYERVMILAGFGGYKPIKSKYGVKLR